jgi:hypothetical protein
VLYSAPLRDLIALSSPIIATQLANSIIEAMLQLNANVQLFALLKSQASGSLEREFEPQEADNIASFLGVSELFSLLGPI